MATISKIHGHSDPALTAPVNNTARPKQSAAPRPPTANDKIVMEILEESQHVVNKEQTIDLERAREIAANLQETMDRVAKDSHKVTFHRDARSQRIVIEITNVDGSIVRQFPPEKILNLMRKLDDLSGMVIDTMT